MKNENFILAPQLESDTYFVADLSLSRVLLMNDRQYPWIILVPRVNNVSEIVELSGPQQNTLLQESNKISRILLDEFAPDKLNIAALGNVVPQLHMHHVARFHEDVAWPKPVWGFQPVVLYTKEQAEQQIESIQKHL